MEYYEILEKIKKDVIVDIYTESFTYKCKKGPKTEQAKLKQSTIFFLDTFIK